MIKDFLSSIKAFWEAWTIIVDKKLWLYLWVPGLISVFYGLLVGVSAWYFADNLHDIIFKKITLDESSKLFSRITSGLLSVGIATTGVVIYKYVILVILSPLLSVLSRRVEEAVAGYSISYRAEDDETTIKDFVRAILFGLRAFGKELLFTISFITLGLLPVFGYLVAPLIFIIQSLYAGFCTIDSSLNRYFSISGASDFTRKNLGIPFGIGVVFMLFIMIPVIGLFFAPSLSVAAATLKTVPRIYRPAFT